MMASSAHTTNARTELESQSCRAFLPFADYVRLETVRYLSQCLERDSMAVQNHSDRILHGILDEVILNVKRGPSDARAGRDELLADVIFVALNHTPLTRPTQRAFVAALNWDNVAPQSACWLSAEANSTDQRSPARTPVDAPIIWSMCNKDSQDREKTVAQSQWQKRWREYQELTERGERKHGWTTWNQYLLRHCLCPSRIGITWGLDVKDSTYGTLGVDTVTLIGLPKPDAQHWTRAFYDLAFDAFRQPPDVLADLTWIRERWQSMGPAPELGRQALSGIAWTLFHLLRSFAIWGGNAFLSIPFTFGIDGRDNTGVLSLCTMKPLSPAEIDHWTILTEYVFNPIVSEDARSQIHKSGRESGRVVAYQRIGHALKACTQLTGWSAAQQDLLRAKRTCKDPEIARILAMGARTCALFSFAQGLGSLIRVDAVLADGNLEKIKDWLDDDSFDRWQRGELSGALEAYRDTLVLPAKAICHAFGLPVLQIRWAYEGEEMQLCEWESKQDDDEFLTLARRRSRVPPFRYDSDVVFILFPVVAEPLMNAAKHLLEFPELCEYCPLTFQIVAPKRDPTQPFQLSIGNPTYSTDGALPAGIHDAQGLVESTGLAKFADSPRIEQLEGKIWMYWIDIELYPWRLAEAIQKARRNGDEPSNDGGAKNR